MSGGGYIFSSVLVLLLVASMGWVLTISNDSVQFEDLPERAQPEGVPVTSGPTEIPMHGRPSPSEETPNVPGTAPAGGAAAGGGEEQGQVPEASEVVFSGTIEIDPSIELPATYRLYVNAGEPPSGSPQYFTRLYDRPTFPLTFALRGEDMPFGDAAVEAPLALYVILSEAGHVGAAEGLYIRTKASAATAPGTKNIVLRITR